MFLGEVAHLRHRVLAVRIDSHERHALRCVLGGHLGQTWTIELAHWALDSQENHDHGLRILEVRQRVRLAAKVRQRKIFDLFADGGRHLCGQANSNQRGA